MEDNPPIESIALDYERIADEQQNVASVLQSEKQKAEESGTVSTGTIVGFTEDEEDITFIIVSNEDGRPYSLTLPLTTNGPSVNSDGVVFMETVCDSHNPVDCLYREAIMVTSYSTGRNIIFGENTHIFGKVKDSKLYKTLFTINPYGELKPSNFTESIRYISFSLIITSLGLGLIFQQILFIFAIVIFILAFISSIFLSDLTEKYTKKRLDELNENDELFQEYISELTSTELKQNKQLEEESGATS